MESRDVLADDVDLRRPRDLAARLRISGGRQIARQRIEPHVDRLVAPVTCGERERNPPIGGRARDRDVVETAFDEREDLVIAAGRSDEPRVRTQKLGEELLVAADDAEFAAQSARLLVDGSGAPIGAAARARVLASYAWESSLGRLEQLLTSNAGLAVETRCAVAPAFPAMSSRRPS